MQHDSVGTYSCCRQLSCTLFCPLPSPLPPPLFPSLLPFSLSLPLSVSVSVSVSVTLHCAQLLLPCCLFHHLVLIITGLSLFLPHCLALFFQYVCVCCAVCYHFPSVEQVIVNTCQSVTCWWKSIVIVMWLSASDLARWTSGAASRSWSWGLLSTR